MLVDKIDTTRHGNDTLLEALNPEQRDTLVKTTPCKFHQMAKGIAGQLPTSLVLKFLMSKGDTEFAQGFDVFEERALAYSAAVSELS
jgi:hypothetical protein